MSSEPLNSNRFLVDLRSFATIGFQDAPNGLWLGKQGYGHQERLLQKIIDTSIQNKAKITAITTEDDKILPGYPEDRFGFLANQLKNLPSGYKGEKIDDALMALQSGQEVVYLVNSETLHAPPNDNWGGIKVQIIGRNMLPKSFSLPELLNYCREQGLPTLLCNAGANCGSLIVAEMHAEQSSAIVTHDANNVFPEFIKYIPILGKSLSKYTRSTNTRAGSLVEKLKSKLNTTDVAVSSSHYLHQMGQAGIYVEEKDLSFENSGKFLDSLKRIFTAHKFENKKGYNSARDVLKFGYLLGKHGFAPDRFEGTLSSYNN